ncbi:MAG: ABC transporter ATP-binding protein/permease [Alphaproteobacteria bacterium]|nr:ABC transporter ATP-binding protein/permease [Alphaproteobacteria bacterium]
MTGFRSTLAAIWRLAIPYFRSEDRVAGLTLLAAIVAMELTVVGLTVLLNQWRARFYNALQELDWDAFVRQLAIFALVACGFIVVRVFQTYLNQWLQIRWRRFLTTRYLGGWLGSGNHYRMQLLGDAADNPDQRISEDIRQFIDGGSNGVGVLPMGLGLLNSVVTLLSFLLILWGLSDDAKLTLFGWEVPGFLVWVALIYAVLGTLTTHLIGRVLTKLNYDQQHYEADFRFHLVRSRENSEQIALLQGETAERERHMDRFAAIVANWMRIMKATLRLSIFTNLYSQVSVIIPYVIVAPAFFAKRVQLGGLMQTADAFSNVQDAMSFFITVYRSFAEWRAVIERLSDFETAIHSAQKLGATAAIGAKAAEVTQLELHHLQVALPDGKPVVAADGIAFAPRDRALVTGPSGAGKSTLLRAIAGIWPFGRGEVAVPSHATTMTLPQRPYLPIGTLAAAVSYPSVAGSFDPERIRELLVAVGLPAFASRLTEEEHWNRMLSLGEQQRIAITRAILHAPDYLLLDEATASLDEPAEAALYRLLQERLPATTIVSIGHRTTLAAFHKRHLALTRDGDHFSLREAAPAPA